MKWKDAAAALKKVAPAAASAIAGGGPLGGLVAGVVAERLGVAPTPGAVIQAVRLDPDAAAKLAGLEAEVEKARLADVQHARETHREHWMPSTLTLIYVVLLIGVLLILTFFEVPVVNRDIIFTIIGAILARFTQGGDYWLGSSRGSANKQSSISEALRQKD